MAVDITDLIQWYLAFAASTVVHEAAHAWTALRLGDATAARSGQASLDPTPHLRREPLGMIAVPILSFLAGGWMIGWGSAPYDAQWARNFPRRAALMSLAGPVSNLLLAAFAVLLMAAGLHTGFFQSPTVHTISHWVDSGNSDWSEWAGRWLSILFSLNLLLAAFNLVPLPPLDGSNAVALFLPASAGRVWMNWTSHPQLRILGLFAAWKAFDFLLPLLQQGFIRHLFL